MDGKIGDSGAKKYWYVTDHVGSIRAVTDKDGKKVWSADYLAFGKQFDKSSNSDFEELHSFTGKEYDPDTGLHYYNARWYDSDLGRFISEDPVTDPNNPNLYSYCANNPLRFVDPTGLHVDNTDYDISYPDAFFDDPSSQPGYVSDGPDGGWDPGDYSGSEGSGDSKKDEKKDESKKENDKPNVEVVKSEKEKQMEMDIQLLNFQLEMQIKEYKNAVEEKATQAVLNEILDDIKMTNKAIEYLDNQLNGKNPSRQEVIDYIKKECERIGLPEQIGLAIAWTESRMKQYDEKGKPLAGENKKDGKTVSTDWGIMQINDYAHKGEFDFDQIKNDWEYNITAGLSYALDCYNAAVKAGETNIAGATYSGYNAGISNNDRYRTEDDNRDRNFSNFYENSPWNK